jgi:hypothetical protein
MSIGTVRLKLSNFKLLLLPALIILVHTTVRSNLDYGTDGWVGAPTHGAAALMMTRRVTQPTIAGRFLGTADKPDRADAAGSYSITRARSNLDASTFARS